MATRTFRVSLFVRAATGPTLHVEAVSARAAVSIAAASTGVEPTLASVFDGERIEFIAPDVPAIPPTLPVARAPQAFARVQALRWRVSPSVVARVLATAVLGYVAVQAPLVAVLLGVVFVTAFVRGLATA